MPVAFFVLMCIPKHYIKPQPLPRQVVSRPLAIDMGLSMDAGSQAYHGALLFLGSRGSCRGQSAWSCDHALCGVFDEQAQLAQRTTAKILYAPNSSDYAALMRSFAQGAACPRQSAKKASYSASFFRYFRQEGLPFRCEPQEGCLADPVCYEGLLGNQIEGYASEDAAVQIAMR